MRPIDADALMEDIAAIEEELEDMLDEYLEANHIDSHERTKIYISIEDVNAFKEMIEEAPTVERPRGEWINHLDLTEDYCGESKQCSLCGYKDYNTRRFLWHKFCPNCGADMRGEGE